MANKPQTYLQIKPRLKSPAIVKPDTRPSPSKRGYDSTWRYLREWYLKEHPLCVDCTANDKVVAAREIHHIVPLADGGTNDESNLIGLCRQHHQRRTNEAKRKKRIA